VAVPTVDALTIAPVKALAAVRRLAVRLDPDGVAEDRRLFLLRPDGSVATQRRHPALTAVVPDLDLVEETLSVTFPDGTVARSDLQPVGEPVHATLFGKARPGRLVEGEVAEALSAYVGEPLRLVLGPVGVGWDEGPVSLVSTASIDAVGVPEEPAVDPAARFRMLVEVGGLVPFDEEDWVGRDVRIGQAVVAVTHRLGRCVVIEHSPRTGAKDWSGVRTLAELRGPQAVTLGVIGTVRTPGVIRVGDVVEPA
jgi:uncharacterized protein YcbX